MDEDVNPYLTVLDQENEATSLDARRVLTANMDSNPDLAARALPYAEKRKIPLDMAERNIDEIERDEKYRDNQYYKVLADNPTLGSFIRRDENARIAHDDLTFLDKVGKTVSDIPTAVIEGQNDVTLGVLRDKQMRGLASAQDIAMADALSNRVRPEQLGTGGFFSDIVTGVAGQIPVIAEVGKTSLMYGGAAAGGAALIGQAGPQVAAPEEIITVPAAFTAGSIVGAFDASRKIEGGLAYDEFLKFEDAQGNKLDPDTARGAAMVVGMANGALELLPLKKLVNTVPGIDKLTGYFTKDGIKQAVKYPGVREALGRVGKNYAELVITEGATEAAQEAMTMYTGELLKALDDGDYESTSVADQINRIAESGKQGMMVSLGLGFPGTIVTSGKVIAENNGQPEPEKVLLYLKNARDALSDPDGKLMGRSRAKMREYLEDNLKGQTFFIDGEKTQTFYQGLTEQEKEAIRNAIPDFEDSLNQAADTKDDVQISRADYFAYFQQLDQDGALDEYVRMAPEHYSAADIREYDEMMADLMEQVGDMEEAATDGDVVEQNFYQQLLQKLGERKAPSGRVDVARMLSQNPRAFYETILERSDNNPQVKAVLDRLVRDVAVRRVIPNLPQITQYDQFDLLMDRVRNRAADRARRDEKSTGPDLFGQTKSKKRKGKARPTPVISWLGKTYGIRPTGAIGKELASMDITPKSHGRLFSAKGVGDVDNIPADEFNAEFSDRGIVAQEDGNGYVDRDWLLDQIRSESFGEGALTEEQAAAEIDQAYMDDLELALDMAGIDIDAPNAEIKAALEQYQADMAADIQPEFNLDEVVADVTETQEQADQLKEKVESIEQEEATQPEFTPEQKPEPIVPEQPIEDFGEKIEGARKDMYQAYQDKLTEELPDDYADITLSKYFPEPDYEKMIEAGVSVDVLAAVKAMRDPIPNKPRKAYKLKRWGEQVKALREFSSELIDGKYDVQGLMELMRMPEYRLGNVADDIQLYMDLGYPAFTKAKGYSVVEATMFRDAQGNRIEKGEKAWTFIRSGRFGGQRFESRDDAVDYLRSTLNTKPDDAGPKRRTKLDIYQIRATGEIIIGKKVASQKFIDLKTGFKDVKEARQYLKDNEDALLVMLEKKKDIPPMRRDSNEERSGEDYRMGENVTPERFAREFGFRGVQFGNYVEQGKRQEDLNNAYDALLDMADIIAIPGRAVSLNGSLGLAFGARGKGGKTAPKAHYERGEVVINLTKKDGAGSLAHEWWHGLDNYFGNQREGPDYLTARPSLRKLNRDGTPVENQPIREEVVEAFKGVMDAINATDIKTRAYELDKRRTKDYWSTDIEMSARSFEAYIIHKAQQKGEANDYLANITGEDVWKAMEGLGMEDKGSYPYPTQQEMEQHIAPAFDKLFNTLKTRETDKGVELYQQDGDKRGSITFTPDGKAIIQLFEKENLTTVMHELGHLYWKALSDIAALDEAPEQIKADVKTMRDWVGAEDGAALTVEQEEKIADGFLKYIQEGNAPSVDLQSAFQRMKTWIKRIYSGFREKLLPNLNNEVRDVFDRMLATDQAIERVKAEPEFQIDEAIMSLLPKAQADRMQKKFDRAVQDAKERLLKKALKQAERRNTKTYKENRAAVRKRVEQEVLEERQYDAIDKIIEAGGLDRKTLVRMFGKEILPYLSGHGGLVKAKGGVHPDVIADLTSYTNGHEMVLDLMNTERIKDRIDRLTEQEMLDTYGDMLNDGTIEAEAMQEYHNNLREEVLEMEVKMLAELAGIPAPTKDGIKAAAIKMMGERKVRDIIPYRHLRAENKAYYEYGKALGQQQYAKAARAKAQQLLNHHMYRMSLEARKKIDSSLKKWRRFARTDKKLAQQKSINIDYVYAIRSILAKYDIGRSDYAFGDWFDQLKAESPESAQALAELINLNTEGAQNYKDITFDEFMGLRDAIEGITEIGRDVLAMEIDGQRATAREAAEMAADTIYENNPERDRSRQYQTLMDKSKEWVSGFDKEITRMEFILKALDGNVLNGTLARMFIDPLAKADAENYKMGRQIAEKFKGILEKNSGVRTRWRDKVYDERLGQGFTVRNIVTVALNMGNEGNLGKLLDGYEWEYADVKALVERYLTKEDMDTVQEIWDLMEELRPDLQRVHKQVTGFPMEIVKADALDTKWGQYRGGYFPVVYDPTRSAVGQRNQEDVSVFESNFTIPSVGKGMTKSRVDFSAPMLLDFDSIVAQHFSKTIHLITHGAAVKDINRIIMQERFKKAIIDTAGVEAYAQFKPWLQAVASNTVYDTPVGFMDKMVRHLRVATTNLFMGFGISTGIKQLLGLTTTYAAVTRGEVSRKNFWGGMRQYITDPGNASQFIMENSLEMPGRLQHLNADVANVIAETGRSKNVVAKVQYAGMAVIGYTQIYMVDMPTWIAGYKEGLERFEGNKDRAVAYADTLVRQTQGSGSIKDLSKVQRGSEIQKAVASMFGTYIIGVLYPKMRELGIDTSKGNVARSVATLVPLIFLPALLEGLMADPPEDDEEWLEWYLTKSMVYGASSVPIAGGFVEAAAGEYDYSLSAIESPINMMIKGLRSDDPEKFTKGLVVGTGLVTRLPTYKPYRTLDELIDQMSGEEDFNFAELVQLSPDRDR